MNNDNQDEENAHTINDQLLLEMIILGIRGETIKYSSRKKKENNKQEKQLEEDILKLEKKICESSANQEEINALDEKKNRLHDLRKNTIEGVLLRSRCRYEDLGEKPSSYFFNLEKRNFTNKVITKIIESYGHECLSTEEILNSQKTYFRNLYSDNNIIDNKSVETLIGENPLKLTENEADLLEGDIKYSELAEALKNMKNSKTPGSDGFTAEFFKFFWPDLKHFILNSLNFGYRTGSFSITQRQGIITCLPKPNKSPFYLKNWRPISLLNVIYKLASSVIAARLKSVLHRIINQDQKGFISGRFIGENIRLIYDILFETKQQEIPGLILSIDFQQAFDSVSWKFIHKTLDYFNFGPSFKRWIEIFQHGSESCILQNGHMTDYFSLQRGCRQGDPISPYIFILCAEVLSHMIRKDQDIKGIIINNKEYKLSQYADDTQIFLDGTEISLRKTLEKLNTFYLMSGLKLNIEKTKAIWIGSTNKSNIKLCHEYNLDWNQEPFKVLGVTFTTEVFDIWDKNATAVLKCVEQTIKSWSKRNLTLIGKITIMKSLALAKFVHLFLALPNPPGELIKNLNKLFYSFLWNSGPDRIKRKVIVKDMARGGLRMIQVDAFITALKLTWFRRYTLQSDCSWSSLSKIDFNSLFSKGENYAELKANEILNPFWKDTLKSWKHFCKQVEVDTLEDILNSPLWLNSHLPHSQNMYIKEWYDKGVRNISDLIDSDGNFYQLEELKTTYNIRGTFLDYHSILRRIPDGWKNKIQQNSLICQALKHNVERNLYVKLLCQDKRGSRRFYNILIGDKNPTLPIQSWVNSIGNITQEEWNNINIQTKKIKEVKLKDFQFKINNHIIVTKSFLLKINKIDDDRCSYCNRDTETKLHLFFYCNKVKEFWSTLQNWLQTEANITVELTIKHALFPCKTNNTLLNHLLLLARYFIYKRKFSSNFITLETFLGYVKTKYQNEKYIAKLHNNQEKFNAKWSNISHALQNSL